MNTALPVKVLDGFVDLAVRNSIGSEGCSLAAVNAVSRSHSEGCLPARSAAYSTSATSSGVSLMEMVFVRKVGLLSSLDEVFFACSVAVWKVFIREPPLLTCRFGRAELVQSNLCEALSLQRIYARALSRADSVCECKRAFTFVNAKVLNRYHSGS